MAIKVQITILDSRDFILDYKDFKPTHRDDINIYIWTWMTKLEATKINIKKWND